MTSEETLMQIHYYCRRLGSTANLVFTTNDCTDLALVLDKLKELDKICILEAK